MWLPVAKHYLLIPVWGISISREPGPRADEKRADWTLANKLKFNSRINWAKIIDKREDDGCHQPRSQSTQSLWCAVDWTEDIKGRSVWISRKGRWIASGRIISDFNKSRHSRLVTYANSFLAEWLRDSEKLQIQGRQTMIYFASGPKRADLKCRTHAKVPPPNTELQRM